MKRAECQLPFSKRRGAREAGSRRKLGVGQWQLTAAVIVVGATAVALAQQPQHAQGTVQAGVSAVLVDVVVHDKKGDPVRDLKQSEFQITEDGVPQTVASFTMVMDGRIPAPDAAAASASAAAPLASRSVTNAAATIDAGPTVTALVFDRLAAESRKAAVQAAQSYLGARSEAPGYVGIFGIDL